MKNLIWLTLLVCLVTLAGCSNEGNINYIEGPGIKVSNGLVVSAHPESSRIGAMILARGGNAIDAAVATELALAVCYPEAGNIGGGGFMVIRTSDGKHHVIDYREKAPLSANRDMYLDKDGKVIEGLSTNTHLASGVPGSVDGILNAHSKFGRLPFSVVIQPAIDLAEKGYPLPAGQAASFNAARKDFIERNDHQTAFVKDSLWKPGDIFRQPELAATLKLIRDKGRDGFYSGITADLIEKEMKRGNGILTTKDLADYQSQWREPLEGSYRGYKIVTVPPPSSGGLILLQILGMIENESLAGSGFHTTSSVHRVIEAERRAFADRAEFMGDPDFVNVPVKGLLNPGYPWLIG
ncbi:MAG: gamma-glutamyltransferase [Bacteroidales bacterium]